MSSAAPLHARVISLVLALSVVVGAWFVFEYSNSSPVPVGQAHQTSDAAKPAAHTNRPIGVWTDSVDSSDQPQKELNLTFKCQKNGRTSFGDTPCDVDAKVLSVTASEKLPLEQDDRLAQMKRQVIKMEADRLAREQTQAAVIASRMTLPEPNKAIQCKEVDDWVASLDSQLRQPHDAQRGDYLAGERKKWMDRRFELRC